jgi:hypothetical protein
VLGAGSLHQFQPKLVGLNLQREYSKGYFRVPDLFLGLEPRIVPAPPSVLLCGYAVMVSGVVLGANIRKVRLE